MKNLTILLCAFFLLCCSAGSAQVQAKALPINEPDYNKPKLFADLPQRVDFNPVMLSNLFSLKLGESANIAVRADFKFSGQVVSKSDAAKSTSVVIRLTSRPGARLIFTKVITENNSVKYLGRIISFKHGDSYEIAEEDNQYYFIKKSIYDLVAE